MIKYWKGQHVILKREDLIDEYMTKARAKLVRSGRPAARMTINQVSPQGYSISQYKKEALLSGKKSEAML